MVASESWSLEDVVDLLQKRGRDDNLVSLRAEQGNQLRGDALFAEERGHPDVGVKDDAMHPRRAPLFSLP